MRAIDADALKDELMYLPGGYAQSFAGNACLMAIDDAPTLDYAPVRHGEWLWDGNKGTCCSRCKTPIPSVTYYSWDDELAEEEIYETPFCPNCGAKMDGGKSDG